MSSCSEGLSICRNSESKYDFLGDSGNPMANRSSIAFTLGAHSVGLPPWVFLGRHPPHQIWTGTAAPTEEVGSGAWLSILIIGFRNLNGKYIPLFLHLFPGQNPCCGGQAIFASLHSRHAKFCPASLFLFGWLKVCCNPTNIPAGISYPAIPLAIR